MIDSVAARTAEKVTADHLRRNAYLYVRQSSLRQVMHNTESAVRQYDLRGRAIGLGWSGEQVIVIDTDQGQSGASAVDRDGFQRLVAEVSMGRAGIVLGLEVSRLARNNADWHRLLEICALSRTLILDEDGLYDPGNFNDRLLLGLKGTMSEAELHLIKARLRGGQLSKARRGELVMRLPIGLVATSSGKVVLDPDIAVQQAVRHLFATYEAVGSATATVKTYAAQQLKFPRRIGTGERKGEVIWGRLEHSAVLRMLHNPRYAGAFSYGRHAHGTGPGGKAISRVLPRDEWVVLIPDAHPGYITWDQFEINQKRLAQLATARGGDRMASPPREGPALLQGIVICGICGRRMTVRYHTRRDSQVPDYVCQYEGIRTASRICQNIRGAGIDQAVGDLLMRELTPLALESALAVADELTSRAAEADKLRAATVERARYHANLARRRYLAVDPDNRLVADSLEADWNNALRELTDATDEYERAQAKSAGPLSPEQRQRITALAADIPALWNNPNTPARERKRMARLLLQDVTISKTDSIAVHIRLRGGQDHTLTLPLPKTCWQLRQTPSHVVAAIDELLDHHTHAEIAEILNQRGYTSGLGQPFHRLIVRNIRIEYQLPSREHRLREQGMLALNEIADKLNVSTKTVKTWRDAGLLTGEVANDKGEYMYHMPAPDQPKPRIGRPPSNRTTQTTSASTRRSAV